MLLLLFRTLFSALRSHSAATAEIEEHVYVGRHQNHCISIDSLVQHFASTDILWSLNSENGYDRTPIVQNALTKSGARTQNLRF
jgi:hypothetical protein